MRGKIPYRGSTAVGAHVVPVRKGMIPTSTKIGYPSLNKKRRIKVTTTTANDAVQKNRVLIARSLRNDKREVPVEVLKAPFIFFMTCTCLPQKKKNCGVPFRCSGLDSHIAFISDNLLAVRADDVLDEVTGKSGGLAVGDYIQVSGDRI